MLMLTNTSSFSHKQHIVIFSHISERDGGNILRKLAQALHQRHVPIQHLIISTYEQSLDGSQDAGKRLIPRNLRLPY